MKSGNYLKLIGLSVDGLEVEITEDKNVKDMEDIKEYLSGRQIQNERLIWVIFPCNFTLY